MAEFNTISKPDTETWNAAKGTRWEPLLGELYRIALVNLNNTNSIDAAAVVVDPSLDPRQKRTKAEFPFKMPPKVHDMTEPFATTIIATQNGGKFVESHGSVVKHIHVSGTTGLRPNRRLDTRSPLPREIPLFNINNNVETAETLIGAGNRGLFESGAQAGVPEDEITGHDDIIFLRNIFRKYADSKVNDNLASSTVMLWYNAKDGDYWVVEPTEFKLVQNSRAPLIYNYDIKFHTLATFQFDFVAPEDPQKLMKSIQRFSSRLSEYSRNIKATFVSVSKELRTLGGSVFSLAQRVLQPAVEIINGLENLADASFDLKDDFVSRSKAFRDDLVDLHEQYQEFEFARKSKESANPVGSDVGFTVESSDDVRFARMLNHIKKMIQLLNNILSEEYLNTSKARDKVQESRRRYAGAYATPSGLLGPSATPYTGGSPAYFGNNPANTFMAQSLVHRDDDIRSLSKRLLGDRRRWQELVIANDLRAPYISDVGGAGVLKPGDAVLYPTAQGVEGVEIGQSAITDEDNVLDDRPLQRSYGRDIRLVTGSFDRSDIDLGQGGDVGTVQGTTNVEQALNLRFATELGELPAHPRYGTAFPIGDKAVSFTDLRLATEASILSDERINSVARLNFTTSGDVLLLRADLVLRDTNDILNTDVIVRT